MLTFFHADVSANGGRGCYGVLGGSPPALKKFVLILGLFQSKLVQLKRGIEISSTKT